MSDEKDTHKHLEMIEQELIRSRKKLKNYNFLIALLNYLFQVPMAVGSLMGMNVGGIPYANNPYGFWFIVLWCFVLGIVELSILAIGTYIINKYF